MAEMTQAQFEVVAELLRSREPVRTAVRLVLVEGATTKDAADAGICHGCSTPHCRHPDLPQALRTEIGEANGGARGA